MKPYRNCKIFTLIAVLAGTIPATSGRAQDCVRVESKPERATITVRRDTGLSSIAPGNFCGLQPGKNYQLSIASNNYEWRIMKFQYSPEWDKPKFSGFQLEKTGRSAFIPGWGLANMGNKARAAQNMADCVYAGIVVGYDRRQRHAEY